MTQYGTFDSPPSPSLVVREDDDSDEDSDIEVVNTEMSECEERERFLRLYKVWLRENVIPRMEVGTYSRDLVLSIFCCPYCGIYRTGVGYFGLDETRQAISYFDQLRKNRQTELWPATMSIREELLRTNMERILEVHELHLNKNEELRKYFEYVSCNV